MTADPAPRRTLAPARIVWDDDGTPRAEDFGDVYHARIGAQVQARQVFLAGCGLPERWRGRTAFTIVETGFGLGHNLLAAWAAWREDAQRPSRLHLVSVESRPVSRADLQRAHAGTAGQANALAQQLVDAWPPCVAGLHLLDFEGGAVRLLLGLGDVRELLPRLRLAADAFFLDGFAPSCNPEMWEPQVIRQLARLARPGAVAATWCVARTLRDGLDAAGFQWRRVPGIAPKRESLVAEFRPHRPPSTDPPPPASTALVVGAGLAGAACAAALAARGVDVQVFDRAAAPAQEGSGNAAGLFHGTVHRDDGPYARLHRAAALRMAQVLSRMAPGLVRCGTDGLLRLEFEQDFGSMLQLIESLGLPADHVQACDAPRASALAGTALSTPAWWHRQAGWASPVDLVRAWLDHPRIALRCGSPVHALRRAPDGDWQLLGIDGCTLATAPQLVLANADGANTLLAGLGHAPIELLRRRGQVSMFDDACGLPRLPLAGRGYAVALPGGRVLCGATSSADGDDDPLPRQADHRANFERLQQLCGLHPPADPTAWQGRVGWRVQPPDRLPAAGPVPALLPAAGSRLDQARFYPREPGLHVLVGLGGRGLTLAALLGEQVAARMLGDPQPLPGPLADLVDPARWRVRAARRAPRDQ